MTAAFRFTSTGTYSQSGARSGAYYVSQVGRSLGIVTRRTGGWIAWRGDCTEFSPAQPTRQAAAQWLVDNRPAD